jgi:glycosyltransferase involved in cell wall biosynthesis
VWLVLPAYNKAGVVGPCIKGIVDEALQGGIAVSILVVDDASTDGTLDAVEKLDLPGVSVAPLPDNVGKGAAVRHGIALAPEDVEYIGFFDADLDIHPKAITDLVAAITSNERAVGAIASKVHPDSVVRYSRFRRMGSLAFSFLARGLIGVGFRDTQTGAKLFKADIGKALASQCVVGGFAFDVELLARASQGGHEIVEAPVELRIDIGSTVAFGNVLQAFLDLWRVRSALRPAG